jgi:hypothetical protein
MYQRHPTAFSDPSSGIHDTRVDAHLRVHEQLTLKTEALCEQNLILK